MGSSGLIFLLTHHFRPRRFMNLLVGKMFANIGSNGYSYRIFIHAGMLQMLHLRRTFAPCIFNTSPPSIRALVLLK